MNGFVLIPWGSGFLRLSEAEFAAAMGRGLAPGAISGSTSSPATGQPLLDSRAMGERLGVTAEWVENAAKTGAIPSLRLGRYLRFDADKVLAAIAQGDGDD